MPNRLTKLPLAVYVAAVKPVAGRAAYCVQVTRPSGLEVAGGGGGGGGGGGNTSGTQMVYLSPTPYSPQYGGDSGGFFMVPTYGSGVRLDGIGSLPLPTPSPLTPKRVGGSICYPEIRAVAGNPARVDFRTNVGWNAGARSVKPIPQAGQFSGTLAGSLIATQFGFSRRGFDHTYQYMSHSIVARPGEWTVVERGITKASGPLGVEARLTIQRINGEVTYFADDEELYTSATPSSGEVYGAALLYSIGDAIDAPVIRNLSSPLSLSIEAPMPVLLGADGPLMSASLVVPAYVLLASLSPVQGVMRAILHAPMPALIGADRPIVVLDAVAPMMTLSATLGRTEQIPTQLVAIVPPPIFGAVVITGGVLGLGITMPMAAVLGADKPLMYLNAKKVLTASIISRGVYMPPGEIDGMDGVVAYDQSYLDAALVLVSMDAVEVGGAATITMVLELSTMDSLQLVDSSSLGQLVEMLAMDRVHVYSATTGTQQQAIQYAVNAITGAPTKYEGFDFVAFASVEGDTYGVRTDGLYRVGGLTDDGGLINALVDWGTSDFSDARVKRIDSAYLGVRTDGQCFLRVRTDEGRERVYRVRGESNVKRAILSKGVAGRSWSISLEVADASFAEVDALELRVGATQRRGFGYRTR